MSGISLLVWVAAGLASWTLTGIARRYTIRKGILDVPIARSSHSRPMPLGGGLAIAAVSLGGIALLGALGLLPARITIGLLGGGVAVAIIGWLDDRHELTARSRLTVHLFSAVWLLSWVGGVSSVVLGPYRLEFGLIGNVLAAVMIVWFINLYNFMDGIDGLAGGQAVLVGTIGAGLLMTAGRIDLAITILFIAAASAGFLAWNWAPARIFMGDAGSGMLGYLFIGIALFSERQGAVPLVAWLILLGAFIFDATVTLIRRVLRGEDWREGHRLHAFQRALRITGSHARVTTAFLLMTVALGTVAGWAVIAPDQHLLAVLASVGLLTLGYLALEGLVPMVEPTQVPLRADSLLSPVIEAAPEPSLAQRSRPRKGLTRTAR